MKLEPKFKVGDKVKVLRASTNEEEDLWGDAWVDSMNRTIGTIATITHVDYDNKFSYPKYKLDSIGMSFPEFVLQAVVKIGEQLLLWEE